MAKKTDGEHVISVGRAFELKAAENIVGVSYGAGVDSTAMLVEMYHRGLRPDFIIFSDTGDEKPPTLAYLDTMDEWLSSIGFPPIIRTAYGTTHGQNGSYSTLEQNCLVNGTIPSLAFGFKGCSGKWKTEVMERDESRMEMVARAWLRGLSLVKLIGYNASPADKKRGVTPCTTRNYLYAYPLRDWNIHRGQCLEVIRSAGLPVPLKSACWHCPASTPDDIRSVALQWPDFARRIIRMEFVAWEKGLQGYEGDHKKGIFGLWGRGRKGRFRHVLKRPGSMSEFLAADRKEGYALLPEFEGNPLGLVDWWNQEGYFLENPNGIVCPDEVWAVSREWLEEETHVANAI